jgi:hypothetical protein
LWALWKIQKEKQVMFPCNCECCKKHLETINELQKILFSKFTPTIVETPMSEEMREAVGRRTFKEIRLKVKEITERSPTQEQLDELKKTYQDE